MPEVRSDLIYDVGLFDGGDTAYYLFRGYNVVAIDANPLMIENARSRFAKEIEAKRLTLLNTGISETPGTATFWVSDVPEWSSFDREIAGRDGAPHRPVAVPAVPFSQLLAEHGVPHYLKIDIEGNDRLCVDALKGASILPTYISTEAECIGDSTVLSDDEAIAMLTVLKDLGYRKFKLLKQGTWTPVRGNAATHFCMRLVNSVARGRLKVPGLSALADRFTDSARVASLGFAFPTGASGPWGDDIPGAWMKFDEARSAYLRERKSFFSVERALHSFWYDWHATY